MTVKLSTGLRAKMLNGGTTGGIKGALALGFINIYSGPQPLTADAAATGTLLGTVSVNGGGTGLTFDATTTATLTKAAAEVWKFTGLADGVAGYARFYPAGGSPGSISTTEARIDASIATSGADLRLSSVSIVTGAPATLDAFSITIPAQ